jgi:hypothetical protein
MKIENRKIAAQFSIGISTWGLALVHSVRSQRVGAVARLFRWPRCSTPSNDSTGERRWLRRARWGGGVLTEDGRWRWGGENGPARQHSMAAAELWWLGRASTSPAAGGGNGEGEAQTKRGGRQGQTRRGDGVLGRALTRENKRGNKRGGTAVMRHHL